MSKYNYKGIIEAQKKEKIIEEYMCFSSNELVEILIDRDLEIERLNSIINELENEINIAIKELQPGELVNGINLLKNIKITLKELKGSESNE